ncbi:MAG: hypothetical protein ACK481_01560 [Candidatus Melainabacteria bacterium]
MNTPDWIQAICSIVQVVFTAVLIWKALQDNKEIKLLEKQGQFLSEQTQSLTEQTRIQKERWKKEIKPWFHSFADVNNAPNKFSCKNKNINFAARDIVISQFHQDVKVINQEEKKNIEGFQEFFFLLEVPNHNRWWLEFTFQDEEGNCYKQRCEREGNKIFPPVPIN